jgi:hypothetical protein
MFPLDPDHHPVLFMELIISMILYGSKDIEGIYRAFQKIPVWFLGTRFKARNCISEPVRPGTAVKKTFAHLKIPPTP